MGSPSTLEVILTFILGLAGTVGVYLGIRQSKRADVKAEDNKASVQEEAAAAQIYTNYKGILDRYQSDYDKLRAECAEDRAEAKRRLDGAEGQIAELKQQIQGMKGMNGMGR